MTADKPIKDTSKMVISVEDFLGMHIRHPQTEDETIRVSATNLMKLLGVKPVGQKEAKRANVWLRQNGFRNVSRETIWKVALISQPNVPWLLV